MEWFLHSTNFKWICQLYWTPEICLPPGSALSFPIHFSNPWPTGLGSRCFVYPVGEPQCLHIPSDKRSSMCPTEGRSHQSPISDFGHTLLTNKQLVPHHAKASQQTILSSTALGRPTSAIPSVAPSMHLSHLQKSHIAKGYSKWVAKTITAGTASRFYLLLLQFGKFHEHLLNNSPCLPHGYLSHCLTWDRSVQTEIAFVCHR